MNSHISTIDGLKNFIGTQSENRLPLPSHFRTIVRQNFRKDLLCSGSVQNNVFLDSKHYLGITRCYNNRYMTPGKEPYTFLSYDNRSANYTLKKLFKNMFISHSTNILGSRKLGRLVYCKTKYKKVAPALRRFGTKLVTKRSITNNLFRSGKNISYAYFNVGYRSRVAKFLQRNLLTFSLSSAMLSRQQTSSLSSRLDGSNKQSAVLYLKEKRLDLLSKLICNKSLIKSVFR